MFRACHVTWLLFLLLLKLGALNVHLGFVVGCHEAEREALLKFKQSLNDTQNRLSSWEGQDCCHWKGVGCDNVMSYVNRLDLHESSCNPYNDDIVSWLMTSTKLDHSLVELSRLNYLDLSCINFQGSQIPGFIGSFKHLRYLNLSYSNFGGVVPSQLGNLTRLRTLDLSMLVYTAYSLSSDLNWVSRLLSLQYLNMNNVHIYRSMNSTHMLNMPPLLRLQLSNCQLKVPPFLTLFSNFTKISTIQQVDLSSNYLEGSLPTVFVNMTSLRYLDLSENQINGAIPLWLKNMRKLQHFDLSSNLLEGPFPHVFANITSLTYLDLSSNYFNGSIPLWIQNMGKLQNLNLYNNNFSQVEGGAIMGILGNLCKLKSFDLSGNSIGGEIGAHHNLSKCATYDLEDLELSGNMIGGTLPSWLGDFKSLRRLFISGNAIEGPIPEGLGQCKALVQIGLSSNNLRGVVSESLFANLSSLGSLDLRSNSLEVNLSSDWSPPFQLTWLGLKSCKMQMEFPRWIGKQTGLDFLDLSDNMLSGKLDALFQLEHLEQVNLSHNQFTGPVPYFSSSSPLNSIDLSYNLLSGPLVHSNPSAKNDSVGAFVCHLPSLQFLDLQRNNIIGTIPDCWDYSEELEYINFSSNNLSGTIPMSMGQAPNLNFLKLSNNSLQGPIPPTLSSSSNLQILDLGENKLIGNIPFTWNRETHPSLKMLRLRGNQLDGAIPTTLCSLPMLQLIDLAHNNLTGDIPRCFGNLKGMQSSQFNSHNLDILSQDPLDDITTVVLKGAELPYTRTLKLVVNLDLSCNVLVGSIPDEITNLARLIGLNLSHNHLSGIIPMKIGDMTSLESLDLSNNNLSGTIPSSMSNLTSLSIINLSNNKLYGQIPTGSQLQTLTDPSAYEGNPGLCGDPLPNKCETSQAQNQPQQNQKQHDKKEDLENPWFYFVIISGVATGFWGVVGSLLLKDRFRFALFQLVDNVVDYLYVQVMIRLNRFRN
ncbi:hypothetical protein RND81_07G206500 [Saponaria officinalis]|uniref:Leucine-rich repeat-containing N-terminal plant-type domain-containing protein n=3 Tax=Saponaria officinalis TaxID=3572 RepID=A0AAW1JTX4_SAPOF